MFKREEEVNLVKIFERAFKEDYLPVLREIIAREVAEGIEKTLRAKQTRMESLSNYLQLLYEAQRSDHRCDKEIDEALKLFREEAGF